VRNHCLRPSCGIELTPHNFSDPLKFFRAKSPLALPRVWEWLYAVGWKAAFEQSSFAVASKSTSQATKTPCITSSLDKKLYTSLKAQFRLVDAVKVTDSTPEFVLLQQMEGCWPP
jgi:hypothetical protein